MSNFFILMTFIDFSAALIIFAASLRKEWQKFPSWHRYGLFFAIFGLVSQGVRNIQFLLTGVSPTDADLPLWALKDIGISLVAWGYVFFALRKANE